VIAICLAMLALLPHLGGGDVISAAAEPLPAVEPLPVVTLVEPSSAEGAQENQSIAEELPVVKDASAAESAPPDEQPQPEPAAAQPHPVDPSVSGDSDLENFAVSLRNGQANALVGVYAPGVLAMPVTGQPNGDPNYVATQDNLLTQYTEPSRYGVTAILAHNYLNSGRSFFDLKPGQAVYLVYGDGRAARFEVTEVSFYQALEPTNVRSSFRDLNGAGGDILSYDQLFNKVYTQANQLVFQTCLEANGDLSWGRLFVKANPS